MTSMASNPKLDTCSRLKMGLLGVCMYLCNNHLSGLIVDNKSMGPVKMLFLLVIFFLYLRKVFAT